MAPPSLIDVTNVPAGGVFDPKTSYRDNHARIWGTSPRIEPEREWRSSPDAR